MSIPTGSYVITATTLDDPRIRTSYCRINTIKPGQNDNDLPQPTDMLCLVKHIARAKIFTSLKQAMEWKEAKHKHTQVVSHCELKIKELLV